MISWKALFAGTLTTLLLGLLLQLAFSFLLVGQMSFSQRHPEYSGLASSASSILGVCGYLIVMAAGGYVTSRFARSRVCLHALFVASAIGLLSFWLLPEDGRLTQRALLLLIAGAAAAMAGSRCWRRVAGRP